VPPPAAASWVNALTLDLPCASVTNWGLIPVGCPGIIRETGSLRQFRKFIDRDPPETPTCPGPGVHATGAAGQVPGSGTKPHMLIAVVEPGGVHSASTAARSRAWEEAVFNKKAPNMRIEILRLLYNILLFIKFPFFR
jgi:hypothetical protein